MNQSEIAETIVKESNGEYDYIDLMENYSYDELLSLLSQYGYDTQ